MLSPSGLTDEIARSWWTRSSTVCFFITYEYFDYRKRVLQKKTKNKKNQTARNDNRIWRRLASRILTRLLMYTYTNTCVTLMTRTARLCSSPAGFAGNGVSKHNVSRVYIYMYVNMRYRVTRALNFFSLTLGLLCSHRIPLPTIKNKQTTRIAGVRVSHFRRGRALVYFSLRTPLCTYAIDARSRDENTERPGNGAARAVPSSARSCSPKKFTAFSLIAKRFVRHRTETYGSHYICVCVLWTGHENEKL